ncbi:hypothetical protein [Arthrobacter sp. AZCC_0090]|uniref:hypothetical protein n=1 Tax=Arthrobacter sp. AZCC_0090 TaxID=2735881 RepID=UPI0016185F25|nr:hypothetical protein [Arthrobacter sp. AZCC_0090]MBB6406188.1 hypothetical protein [Arthrobacter sp. AZCC_0090]
MIAKIIRLNTLENGEIAPATKKILEIADHKRLVEAFCLASATFSEGPFRSLRTKIFLWWLSAYAKLLTANEIYGGRLVYGRTQPTRDIELHRIWPIGGPRAPRIADFILCVLFSAPALGLSIWVFWYLGVIPQILILLFVVFFVSLLVRTSLKPWVRTASLNVSAMLQPRPLARQTLVALIAGVACWTFFEPLLGLITFVSVWIVVGLTVGFGQTLANGSPIRAIGPETVLRRDHQISVVSGLAAWVLLAFLWSFKLGLPVAALVALLYCLAVGQVVASALWRRYLATILVAGFRICPSPRWLLRVALRRGLVRSRGLTYQFRHDDVRDYLAGYSWKQDHSSSAEGIAVIATGG